MTKVKKKKANKLRITGRSLNKSKEKPTKQINLGLLI